MAVYRFRVTFEDFDDISRDIELKSQQTFEDFHMAIQNSIGFDASKPSSFYMSDDHWMKGKEITNRELKASEKGSVLQMKKSTFKDIIIDPHQKLYYVFDLPAQWTFHVELIKIIVAEDANGTFPRCIKVIGDPPKQYGATVLGAVPEPEEFDETASFDDSENIPEGEMEGEVEAVEINEPLTEVDEMEIADEDIDEEDLDKDDF